MSRRAPQPTAPSLFPEELREPSSPNSPADVGRVTVTPMPPLTQARAPLTFPVPPSAPVKACATCKAPVVWIATASGRRMPVDPDGTSHFATCPQAAQHRRR